MSCQATLASRFVFGLLTIAAFQTPRVHSLPSWLQLPFLRDRSAGGAAISDSHDESGGPETLLIHQLKNINETTEPEKARALHSGIAKILRAEGTQNSRAIQHLQAARNAALRGDDVDAILDAHLELAEVYTEAGYPAAATQELLGKLRMLTPENFWEYSVKLDRANGHASFESGFIQLAFEYFEDAAKSAQESEDIVRCASDMAMAHACLGRSQQSLLVLQNALEVLENARKADNNAMEVDMHRALSMEVHARLAEAFHSMGNTDSARLHYDIAVQLQSKSQVPISPRASAIKANSRNLQDGIAPSFRCPGGAKSQKFQLHTQKDAGTAFKAKVATLLKDQKYKKAEFELWNFLELQPLPYKSSEAATTLVSLGKLYTSAERRSYYRAGQCFMQALQASLTCCGAQSQEAKAAFRGLKFVHDVLPAKDQTKALEMMQEYRDAGDKFSSAANDFGQQMTIDV